MRSRKIEMQQQNQNAECGELVCSKLFLEFVRFAERRIAQSEGDSLHRQLHRGRDSEFDRLLSALGRMAEYCLRPAFEIGQLKTLYSLSSYRMYKKLDISKMIC